MEGYNRLKYENCAIKKANIFSNELPLEVNLTAAPDVQYAESILVIRLKWMSLSLTQQEQLKVKH